MGLVFRRLDLPCGALADSKAGVQSWSRGKHQAASGKAERASESSVKAIIWQRMCQITLLVSFYLNFVSAFATHRLHFGGCLCPLKLTAAETVC